MSVGGLKVDIELKKFLTGVPVRSWETWDDGQIQGVLVKIDEESGKAVSITPIRERVAIEKPEVKA